MTADEAVAPYLRVVAACLPGPARARDDILAELRSGLHDAIDTHQSAGLTVDAATAAAIREFGTPRQVAEAFRPHLAMIQARRVALALVATGPLIGLLWTVAALASHIAIWRTVPWQWHGASPMSAAAFPVIGAALLIVIWSVLATVAATGTLTRWLPASPRFAATTAATASLGTVVADSAMLALVASTLTSSPGTLAPLPITAAVAASLVRLALTRRGVRNCLALRATLG